ncbi:PQQ-dependent sugar dehydrogenase [Nocardia sp. NPDC057353]|uniref:PQQ-dependent sugar dehydrogenase n=1 Tax=Nocardia sp. NPDC057353 TaxID=3346104 RepID=UPI003637838A
MRLARTLTTLSAAVLLAACGAADTEESPAPPSNAPATEPGATPTPEAAGAVDLGAPTEVAAGLDVPWGLAFRPDGTAFVAERDTGRILRIAPGGGPAEPVYQVPGVVARGEGGLLGLAVSPTDPDRLYAYFTAESDNRIVRFRLGEQPEVVFAGLAKAGNHNGGRIAFGPDGMLYVGTGDAGDPRRSPDRADPSGKILRLTPDGQPAPGNPEPNSPVHSSGHRNVQGLAWDSRGRLFAAEFGQNRLDEVNLIEPGRDYGWPAVEGTGGADRGYADPLVTWGTDEASPSGIAVAGDTLYVAALRGERLWTVPIEPAGLGTPRSALDGSHGRLRTVAVAPDGALWVTTSNTDGRGDLRDGDDRILRFPAR